MTDREKLIEPIDLVELIDNARKATKNEEFSCGLARKFFIAEYLISHGVTVQKWIPVTEPPKTSGRYILLHESGAVFDGEYDEYIDDGSRFGVWEREYDRDTLGCLGADWREYEGITHWMPLPKPQKEG